LSGVENDATVAEKIALARWPPRSSLPLQWVDPARNGKVPAKGNHVPLGAAGIGDDRLRSGQ
jgi:hypothetical protein